MAVHKRAYRPYEGPLTSQRWRLLVLPRFALMDLFDSRLLTAFMVFCFVPFLAEAGFVYLTHSAAARAMIGLTQASTEAMRPEFFMGTLMIQGALAFFLTAWVAPVLVSPDLVNGALPLFLSRPLSRAEYVMGKAVVLAALLSAITWVPVLTLFGIEAGLAEGGWGRANLRTAWAAFLGAWIWIAVLTLLGLALSSWIRWRIVASGALFGVFFAGSAFGEMWREILGNAWGRILNPSYLVGLVWRDLFGVFADRSVASEMLNDRRAADLPTWVAWTGLALMGTASIWLLERRLRAREVVS